jgi:hypothetical protein
LRRFVCSRGGHWGAPIRHVLRFGCGIVFAQLRFLFWPLFRLVVGYSRLGNHLRRHTAHTNDTGPDDAFPENVDNATTGPSRTPTVTRTFLRRPRVGGADFDYPRSGTETAANLETGMHDLGEEVDAFLLPVFRRIERQATFVALITSRNIKGTTSGINTSQTTP